MTRQGEEDNELAQEQAVMDVIDPGDELNEYAQDDMSKNTEDNDSEDDYEDDSSPDDEQSDVEADGSDSEEDEESDGKEDNDELTGLKQDIAALKEAVLSGQTQQPTPEQLAAANAAASTDGAPKLVNEQEFAQMFEDADSFNKVMNNASAKLREDVMASAMETVAQVMTDQQQLQGLHDEFYRTYPGLKEHKEDLVGPLATRLVEQHPEWGPQQIMKETGDRLSKHLGIENGNGNRERNRNSKRGKARRPGMAPGSRSKPSGGSRKPKTAHDRLLDELIAGELR